jgi:hypothetical protein
VGIGEARVADPSCATPTMKAATSAARPTTASKSLSTKPIGRSGPALISTRPARRVQRQKLGPIAHDRNAGTWPVYRAARREPNRLQAERGRADDVFVERVADEPRL